jgi:two-component system OmpR family response regulator
MKHKVLIVEDNPEIADLVRMHLKDIHCEADIANDGAAGLERFRDGDYDLVILDLMLPVMDGLEVCKQLRLDNKVVPVIMLTSKSSELDRVLGLEIGADDYLTKPFSIPELLARVKAQFRRLDALQTPEPQGRLSFGALVIEPDKHRVTLADKKIDLTAKEFDLLLYFAAHPGRVYNRAELLDQVWGYSYEGYEHTVNSHINRLRSKIEADPAKPQYIMTVWGVGYKFNEAAEAA